MSKRVLGSGAILLGCLSVLAAGCGGGTPEVKTVASPPLVKAPEEPKGIVAVGEIPPDLAMMTDSVLKMVVRSRGLAVKEPVKLRVMTSTELAGLVKTKVGKEIPPEVVRGEGRTYIALDLLPAGFDYEAEIYKMLEDELAGLYASDDKTMYVARGTDRRELEGTLAHEFQHALQDQHFDVGSKTKYKAASSDMTAAIHALAEGEATSLMVDISIEAHPETARIASALEMPNQDPEDMLESAIAEKKPDSPMARAPKFLSTGLLAPYADGIRFVNAIRRRGGWKAMDDVWANPPTSTEQLLHLGKYDKREPAVDVPIPTGVSLGAGFTKTFDDILGEQQLRLAFTEWMAGSIAGGKRAAGGWGGDRVALFEKGTERAVALKIVFDDESEALEAFQLIAPAFHSRFGIPTNVEATPFSNATGYGPLPALPKPPEEKTKSKLPPLPDATKPTIKPGAKPAAKPVAKPVGKGGKLPSLPDTPIVAVSPTSTVCRMLRQDGVNLVFVSGAPCAVTRAWSLEVVK